MAQRSPVEFLDEVVLPALFEKLDQAFPDFGWKRTARGWMATNREYTKRLPDASRPDRVVCNQPGGYLVHGGSPTSWTAHVSGGTPPRGAVFVEAVRKLADLAGVDASALDRELSPEEAARYAKRERTQELREIFVFLAQEALRGPGGKTARDYLAGRGFPEAELAALPFGLFTAADEVRAQLGDRGFTADEVAASGLLKDGRWSGRLVLPWRDHRGHIATIAARDVTGTAEEGAKYLYLSGGRKPAAFGLEVALRSEARGQGSLVIVEGLLDVVALQHRGVRNAVALGGGGSLLTAERWGTLAGYGVKRATLLLDNDRAGRDGTVTALQNALRVEGLEVWAVDPGELGGAKDPDELLRTDGVDALQRVLATQVSGNVYMAQSGLGPVTPESPDYERRAAVDRVLDLMAQLRGPRAALDLEDLLSLAAERTGYTTEGLAEVAQVHAERRRREDGERAVRAQLRQAETDLTDGGDPVVVAATLRDELAEVQAQGQAPPPAFDVDRLVEETAQTPDGRSSGWTNLDTAEVRFHPGELALLAARTSHGKSTVMVGLLHQWLRGPADPDEWLLFYSLEEPEVRIFHRLLAALTAEAAVEDGKPQAAWSANEVRAHLANRPAPAPDGCFPSLDLLGEAMDRLRSWQDRLQVVYRPGWSVDELAAHAAMVARDRPVGAVLVDYLQRIPPPAGRYDRRDIEVSIIGRRLKSLSVDLVAPVVVGAQLNRQTVTDGKSVIPSGRYEDEPVQKAIRSRRPQLHHLREGGSEQEADLVLGLLNYRADYAEDDTGQKREEAGEVPPVTRLEVGALKNRYGPVGRWTSLAFDARFGYLRDPELGEEL